MCIDCTINNSTGENEKMCKQSCSNCGKCVRRPDYRSAFTLWDQQATVRKSPIRVLQEEQEKGKFFFPPSLIPATQHPLLIQRGRETMIKATVYHLANYLDFTEVLEHQAVNQVAFDIARGRLGFALPPEMKADAYAIYVDEAYHAKFSADLTRQVLAASRTPEIALPEPRFLKALEAATTALPDPLKPLARTFFVIVSETLITGVLTRVPHDESVVTVVREVIADHAEDERRHHAYFSQLLHALWPQLAEDHQQSLGQLIPDFILGFLNPDTDAVTKWLGAIGLSDLETKTVIAEAYSDAATLEAARNASKPTIRHCESSGLLNDSLIRDAFATKGLL